MAASAELGASGKAPTSVKACERVVPPPQALLAAIVLPAQAHEGQVGMRKGLRDAELRERGPTPRRRDLLRALFRRSRIRQSDVSPGTDVERADRLMIRLGSRRWNSPLLPLHPREQRVAPERDAVKACGRPGVLARPGETLVHRCQEGAGQAGGDEHTSP